MKGSINEQHYKLNKSIDIKLKPKTGFMGGKLFSTTSQVFKVPPLNAAIESGFGKGPKNDLSFKSSTSTKDIETIPFLSWTSVRSGKFDDPNKHRNEQLLKYEILKPINQECCGACWAVSSSTAFSDRYGIANDSLPIDPSIITVMSCCTKQMHKNVFAIVDTPDCDINSSYSELGSSSSTMGMCSGGIPFSAGMSIFRNGLPSDNKTKYTASLFKCNDNAPPSFPTMNQGLIDAYPCDKKIFETESIKMDVEPVYISSSQGPPAHYVQLMKQALLEGGPLVGGFMVLGDFLGLGTDLDQGNETFNWDSTGKVYVPGAYNSMFPLVSMNAVGGSTTIKVVEKEGEQSVVENMGVQPKAPVGTIFSGFHAIVIVGWGEMDAEFISNKDVKLIKGSDGRDKLPYWVCRNSWGEVWPIGDYYKSGIDIIKDGKKEILELPGGYWLHAMYPNESMALDVPISYGGVDYGSTMVMIPKKVKSIEPSEPSGDNGTLTPEPQCNTTWEDSEGYDCSQYSEFGWCNEDGSKGLGWKDEWGNFKDFKNGGFSADEVCCQCSSGVFNNTDTQSVASKEIVAVTIFVPIFIMFIALLAWIYFKKNNYTQV